MGLSGSAYGDADKEMADGDCLDMPPLPRSRRAQPELPRLVIRAGQDDIIAHTRESVYTIRCRSRDFRRILPEISPLRMKMLMIHFDDGGRLRGHEII